MSESNKNIFDGLDLEKCAEAQDIIFNEFYVTEFADEMSKSLKQAGYNMTENDLYQALELAADLKTAEYSGKLDNEDTSMFGDLAKNASEQLKAFNSKTVSNSNSTVGRVLGL